MSRLLTRAVRLLKFGAVAGAAVGVGRMVMLRRRQPEATESSWPTIADTAASNGQPVDDQAESVGVAAGADATDDEAASDSDDAKA